MIKRLWIKLKMISVTIINYIIVAELGTRAEYESYESLYKVYMHSLYNELKALSKHI